MMRKTSLFFVILLSSIFCYNLIPFGFSTDTPDLEWETTFGGTDSSQDISVPEPMVLWDKTYGGEQYDGARFVMKAENDCFLIVGSTDSYGNGLRDMYIIKINAMGELVWEKTWGGPANDNAHAAILTEDNHYLILGSTGGLPYGQPATSIIIKMNSDGDIINEKKCGGSWVTDIVAVGDGNYILVGGSRSGQYNKYRDIFIVKVDSNFG